MSIAERTLPRKKKSFVDLCYSDHALSKQNSNNKSNAFVNSEAGVVPELSSPAIRRAEISQQSETSPMINKMRLVPVFPLEGKLTGKTPIERKGFHWKHSTHKHFVYCKENYPKAIEP